MILTKGNHPADYLAFVGVAWYVKLLRNQGQNHSTSTAQGTYIGTIYYNLFLDSIHCQLSIILRYETKHSKKG